MKRAFISGGSHRTNYSPQIGLTDSSHAMGWASDGSVFQVVFDPADRAEDIVEEYRDNLGSCQLILGPPVGYLATTDRQNHQPVGTTRTGFSSSQLSTATLARATSQKAKNCGLISSSSRSLISTGSSRSGALNSSTTATSISMLVGVRSQNSSETL